MRPDNRDIHITASVQRAARSYEVRNPFMQPNMLFDGPIPSRTISTVHYHVTIDLNNHATCACPARTKYHPTRDCSHIALVREVLNTR